MTKHASKFFIFTFLFCLFSLTAHADDTPAPKTDTTKLPDGSTKTTEKDEPSGRDTSVTKLPDGTTIERSTLPGGVRETKIKKPDGSWVVTRKGLFGVVTTSRDTKGNLVTVGERADGSGFERVVDGATKDLRETEYDKEGKPVKTTTTKGGRTEETTYGKDGKPEKTSVSEGGKPVEEITYGPNGQVKDRKDLRKPEDKDKGKEPELPNPGERPFGPGDLSARDIHAGEGWDAEPGEGPDEHSEEGQG